MNMSKKYHFIYKTTNKLSGKFYIGRHSTNDLEDGYLGSGTYLNRAIQQHGIENFEREILEFTDTFESLVELETKYVNMDLVLSEQSYNLAVGGKGGMTGFKYSEEANQANADRANKRYAETPEIKDRISKSVKAKLKEKGKDYWSEEGYQKMLECLKNAERVGTPWTEERKKWFSQLSKDMGLGKYIRTEETIEKLRKSRAGKGTGDNNSMANPEHVEKVRLSKLGRKRMNHPEKSFVYASPDKFQHYLDLGYTFGNKYEIMG